MVRQEYLDRIIEACPVKYHLSGNEGCRSHWPWRMQPVHASSPRYSENSQSYIIDSSIEDPSIGNEEIIERGKNIEADAIVLADFMPFEYYEHKKQNGKLDSNGAKKLLELKRKYDNAYEASLDSIKKGMRLAEKSDYLGKVIIPLQPPHLKSLKNLGRPKNVAIGGLKEAHVSKKIEATKKVRRELGEDAFIHGLGFGATDSLIQEIRENENLLDSIDSRTSIHKAMNNFEYWSGAERKSPLASFTEGYLLEACRRMCGFSDNPKDYSKDSGSVFDY